MTATATEAEHRARLARAIWGYSGLTQPELAEAAGMHPARLRAILASKPRKGATLDELRDLARVAGVPELFALEGFAPVPDSVRVARALVELQRRVAALEARPVPPRIGEIVTREVARLLREEFRPPAPQSANDQGRRGEVGRDGI